MISYKSKHYLGAFLKRMKKEGKTIGFVPTMGALHAGHISLIKAAKEECDIVVSSIFVNPTQFNNSEDLDKYPRTLKGDSKKLKEAGCDVLFTPSVRTMYPNGMDGFEAPDIGNVANVLEGAHRPGHFEGVMQVVSLLLDAVNPTHLYMGLKDFQQFMICSKMVGIQGRAIEMRGMPIIREPSGLAMSSRNERLSASARKNAAVIYKSLQLVKENLRNKEVAVLQKEAEKLIESIKGTKIEYFSIVDRDTLMPSSQKNNLIALCAVWLDGVRLIDNMIL